MSFTDYSSKTRETVLPQCPHCSKRDNLMLIDHAPTNSSGVASEEPVWHCSRCDKVFQRRSYDVESTLTNNIGYSYNSNNVSVDHAEMAKHVANAMRSGDWRGHDLRNEIEQIARNEICKAPIERQIEISIAALEQKIEARLKQAIEIEQDPLTEIRRRVAGFKLR